jgi:hypothetical protein
MKKQSLFLFCLLISVILAAQSPQRFSYQAVIRDAQSALVKNSTIGARFTLLQGSLNGDAVYTETQTVQSNSNGLITAEIGAGTVVAGVFDSIAWWEGPFFIKSEFDIQGGTNYTLSTSSQLLSVPYAMHANTAFTSKTAENGLKNGTVVGEMLYWNGAKWDNLQPGYFGQTLVYCNGKPTWGPCPEAISLTTHEATGIGSNYAAVKISIHVIPNFSYTNVSICYSKQPVPTLNDPVIIASEYHDTIVTCYVENLEMGTTYYARSVAWTNHGEVYGNIISFTTSSTPTLVLGQKYAGGNIFYLDGTGQHGLTACGDYISTDVWGCFGTLIGSGAQNSAVGYGNSNTQAIINGCNDPYFAASYCTMMYSGYYTDWFLPSVEELRLVFQNLIDQNVPGFTAYEYWTSTEYDASKAYFLDSSSGQKTGIKDTWKYVIGIRNF